MFDASRSIRWEPYILAFGSMFALFLTGIMLALLPGQSEHEQAINAPPTAYSVLEESKGKAIVSYSAGSEEAPSNTKAWFANIDRLTDALSDSDEPLPRVLAPHDKDIYQQLFADIEQGNWQNIRKNSYNLTNNLLLGHVKAQQYLHDDYTSRYGELANWLRQYEDHPQANTIYRISERKKPHKGFRSVKPKKQPYLHGYGDSNGLSSRPENYYSHLLHFKRNSSARSAWKHFTRHLEKGNITTARDYIHSKKVMRYFSQKELDVARYAIAHAYVAYNKNDEGYAQATLGLKRSESHIPRLHWVAGLAAWRMGDIEKSAKHFSRHTTLEVDSWVQSASAFWAHRAYSKLGKKRHSKKHLALAAQSPRTFYGMLALAQLGKDLNIQHAPEALPAPEARRLASMPAIQRILALHELGQDALIEREMRTLFPILTDSMAESLITLADRMNQPAVQLRMSRDLLARNPERTSQGHNLDYGRYPMPTWEPAGGFRLDPAFLYALAHLESGFNAHARSYRGALGIMQMLPSTAKYVASKYTPTMPLMEALADPTENMALGQNYVHYLASKKHVSHNLFFLAAAYNAGPGNLSKWQKHHAIDDDPLLFIETIPSSETRNYIEQLLTSYWVYRELMGLGNPTMYHILRNQWPIAEKFRWEEYAHAAPLTP